MNIDDMIRAIPTLTAEEQERLVDAVKASRSLGGSRTKGRTVRSEMQPHAIEVLAAFSAALKRKGMDNTTVDMAAQFTNYAKFSRQADLIGAWVQTQSLNVGQQRKLVQMMAALLRDDLDHMELAVTMRLMMTHAHRMMAVFARAFPGYAEAQMIPLILDARENPNGG